MLQLAFAGLLAIGLAATLVVLKTVATAACLGSGAIGGLLTPSLAVGAALGAFAGGVWNLLWPGGQLAAYAMISGAALLAVTQRAALTAIALVTEFTHATVNLLVPIIIAVVVASGTRDALGALARRLRAREPALPTGS
jgi:H+/Cl- antiporter ClcA